MHPYTQTFPHGRMNTIHPGDRADAERQWREAIATHRVVVSSSAFAPHGGLRWTNPEQFSCPMRKERSRSGPG